MPLIRAANESGQAWEDPTEDALRFLLDDIEHGREKFVVIERLSDPSHQTYIQSIRNDLGEYVIEIREGGPDQHFRTVVPDMESAHDLITSWALERNGWRDLAVWDRMSFSD